MPVAYVCVCVEEARAGGTGGELTGVLVSASGYRDVAQLFLYRWTKAVHVRRRRVARAVITCATNQQKMDALCVMSNDVA